MCVHVLAELLTVCADNFHFYSRQCLFTPTKNPGNGYKKCSIREVIELWQNQADVKHTEDMSCHLIETYNYD